MSRGKLTVRIVGLVFGLMILGGAWLVSQDGSTSREASSPPPASGTTDPGTTGTGTTDSGATDSGTTDSGTTDSGTTDPGTTGSGGDRSRYE